MDVVEQRLDTMFDIFTLQFGKFRFPFAGYVIIRENPVDKVMEPWALVRDVVAGIGVCNERDQVYVVAFVFREPFKQ
jgi:hypothetical protein